MSKLHTEDGEQYRVSQRQFSRRNFISASLKAGAAAFTTGLLPKLRTSADCRNNVLFIIVDDLRPLLGCYGYAEMHTPNIDRLSQRGTLFNRAYCQYPVCNPSRTSILTGLRPETTGIMSNSVGFREKLPNVVTLPQHFKAHGYHTQSVGKIAHQLTWQADVLSWSAPPLRWPIYLDKASIPSWQALDVEDDELRDGKAAKSTVEFLAEYQNTQFFLAVGFRKPHLPFHVPKKYYDLYGSINFDLPSTSSLPHSVPPIAGGNLPSDLRIYQDIPNKGVLSNAKTLELLRGYAASTSFVDAQVGRVLNQLDALGLTENTVIIFCSDHGFHVGDHGTWRKNSLFEVSLRSALIISVPGQTHPGTKTDALVELVDIYPTLCEACQLPIRPELEGFSMMSVVEKPMLPWKTAAFSQLERLGVLGNSIREKRYRYTEWGQNGNQGKELYDYELDPDETVNIANHPENKELVAQLSEQLHARWQETLPDVSERITVPQTLPWDINDDGIVNMEDLLLVSNSFGSESLEHPKSDVNKDGNVNIIDLLLIASHLGETCDASAPKSNFTVSQNHIDSISEWLTEAYRQDNGSVVFRDGITNLEALIDNIMPNKTQLLPNYPNPFNPETWIPYDLAQDTNVDIKIYNLKGETIRELKIGFQNAGTYRTKELAAYWNGCNSIGEHVACGVYFYTLYADQVTTTRRMIIIN